jgi:hypothetical protein
MNHATRPGHGPNDAFFVHHIAKNDFKWESGQANRACPSPDASPRIGRMAEIQHFPNPPADESAGSGYQDRLSISHFSPLGFHATTTRT